MTINLVATFPAAVNAKAQVPAYNVVAYFPAPIVITAKVS